MNKEPRKTPLTPIINPDTGLEVQFTYRTSPTTTFYVNISYFKIIDKDSKQVAREAREAIHIRINNPVLNHNTGKMYVPEIFNHPLEQADLVMTQPSGRLRPPTRLQSSHHSKQQVLQSSVSGNLIGILSLSPAGNCQDILL